MEVDENRRLTLRSFKLIGLEKLARTSMFLTFRSLSKVVTTGLSAVLVTGN